MRLAAAAAMGVPLPVGRIQVSTVDLRSNRMPCSLVSSPHHLLLQQVMHLAGGSAMGAPLPVGRVQVSTMAAGCGLLAAGGFTGELAVRNLQSQRPLFM